MTRPPRQDLLARHGPALNCVSAVLLFHEARKHPIKLFGTTPHACLCGSPSVYHGLGRHLFVA